MFARFSAWLKKAKLVQLLTLNVTVTDKKVDNDKFYTAFNELWDSAAGLGGEADALCEQIAARNLAFKQHKMFVPMLKLAFLMRNTADQKRLLAAAQAITEIHDEELSQAKSLIERLKEANDAMEVQLSQMQLLRDDSVEQDEMIAFARRLESLAEQYTQAVRKSARKLDS